MSELRPLYFSQEQILELKEASLKNAQGVEVVSLTSHPKLYSKVISLGLHQEVGTIHDEISKFLFDGDERILVKNIRSEVVSYKVYTGVRIWVEGVKNLDIRVRGFRSLLHPEFSFDKDGNLKQLVIFPEIIARLAAIEGAELVFVKTWSMNTIFGGFDPSKSYYQENIWEIVNVDALRYAKLLEKRQVTFLGTHDIVSHIAGIKKSSLTELQSLGKKVRELLEKYFHGVKRPVPYTLVLPYALGILIDDLAQPMNYDCESRKHIVQLLIKTIKARVIAPDSINFLLKYPPSHEKLINLARAGDILKTRAEGPFLIKSLIGELNEFSVQMPILKRVG